MPARLVPDRPATRCVNGVGPGRGGLDRVDGGA